ncbi:MAG: hypothetical protein NT027_17940 [Proteobacteria bacterium]|nr:hypothetical protein [Pseudomonadota bacterium]
MKTYSIVTIFVFVNLLECIVGPSTLLAQINAGQNQIKRNPDRAKGDPVQKQSMSTEHLDVKENQKNLNQDAKPNKSIHSPSKSKPDRELTDEEKVSIKPKKTSKSDDDLKYIGIGIDLGANATYGNALKVFVQPSQYLDLQVGIGYNTTGLKTGIGAVAYLPIQRLHAFAGFAGVYSNGATTKVSLKAKFTPENSSSEEEIDAVRLVKVTPSQYLSPFVVARFLLTTSFRIVGQVNYNRVIKGHDVDFIGPIEYDASIEPTNESEADADFREKGRQKLSLEGLGCSLGIQYFF